jgi:hypothetical protein
MIVDFVFLDLSKYVVVASHTVHKTWRYEKIFRLKINIIKVII